MRTKKEIIVLVTFLTASFLSTMGWAVNYPIPDTGQTECYSDDVYQIEINCPLPGEDFYGQDAQYSCNPQSYTKLDASGNDMPFSATGWVMVRDNVTGLIWEVKQDKNYPPNYENPHDADNKYTWQDAQDVFIAALNNDNFGGYSDWRMPTVKELSFIVKRNRTNPAIDIDYFPNTMVRQYWSSTSHADYRNEAWYVEFNYGTVANTFWGSNYVRAVRGRQVFNNFINNGDGTVTDTSYGLMWQEYNTSRHFTWKEALTYCEKLTLAGYTDWRLPNIHELLSIVDYTTHHPAIDTDYFSNTGWDVEEWSSTSHNLSPIIALVIGFKYGYMYSDLTKRPTKSIRAVRQCASDPSTTTTATASTTTIISTSTTTTVNRGICPSETIYGEHSEQTELLRYFRDNVLSNSPEGQEIIKLYYQWSPAISKMVEADELFKQEVKELIDGILMGE